MDIKTQKRVVLTAVGDRDTFNERVASFGRLQGQAETALAGMVAFAYACWHRGGADKSYGVDTIREDVALPKDQGRRLGNCLNRIAKTPIPSDVSPSKAALAFANEFTADFYQHETKLRLAKKAANQERALKKAQEAKKEAAAEEKKIREEIKAEVEGEAEIEVIEFTLIGADGFVTALTEAEYTLLMLALNDIRMDAAKGPDLQAVG